MSETQAKPSAKANVLLIDDQPMIGEAVRRMIGSETDVSYHYLKDPTKAIETADSVRPTVILQDLVMPEIDGLDLVKQFRANDSTREIPMIVLSSKEEASTKAQAFALGANDYMVKFPDKLEVLARIRYHSKGYIAQLERNEAYRQLEESQRLLASEVASAAEYVQSLLPAKLSDGPLKADWRFVPSTGLSGDTFGYHWVDDRYFAFYLLDVVGHGVAAALLSVSALNTLRSQALPGVDFRDPGAVMTGMNIRFPMSQQGEKCFTAWYGVFDTQERTIRYAGGGHPPALLLTGPTAQDATLRELDSTGPVIGTFEDMDYASDTIEVGPFGVLFVYSDGCYEIEVEERKTWPFKDFLRFMAEEGRQGASAMDRLMTHTLEIGVEKKWEDDFSIFTLTL
jgi:sigma-B regulation protein RsbU (phosphoserine phosphatase)